MPVDLSMWLLSCFDPIRSELVIPGRGSILVNAESFHNVFGLRNEGRRIRFELVPEDIAFMNEEYGIANGTSPKFKDWIELIGGMNGVADAKFLRAYLAAALSCFICPTTKSSISPRCYSAVRDLDQARSSNICQLAIEHIISETKNMCSKKNSVCCCLYHLVVLYLDSLQVDEPIPSATECPVRAATWSNQLIQAVIQKDTKPDGGFGRLRFKDGTRATIRDGFFVGITQTQMFVSSKLPQNYPHERKRKLSLLLQDLCTDMSNRMGTFVEEWGRIDHPGPSNQDPHLPGTKRQRADETDEEEAIKEQDDDSETEEPSDDNDNDEDEDRDGDAGEQSRRPTRGADDENKDDEEQGCDLTKRVRRSARLLAMNSPNKGPSDEISHAHEDQSIPNDSQNDAAADRDVTLEAMITSARRGFAKDQASKHTSTEALSGEKAYDEGSPFTELRQFVMSSNSNRQGIDIPYLDPPEFFEITGKAYARSVFMEEMIGLRGSPLPTPPMDQFNRDSAVRKLAEECLDM
ncbi:unnamed protein product [Alopecurus aequalis]